MLKKLTLLLSLCLLFHSSAAMAALRSTKAGNVTTMESAYTYQQPVGDAGQLLPAATTVTKQPLTNVFSIYVKSTRFYNRKFTHYQSLQELAITSNTKAIDLLFDDSLPPRLEYQLTDGTWQTLSLGKIPYSDAYFISFKVDEQMVAPLAAAKALRIVFPYITNGPSETDNPEKTYFKKALNSDSTVAYATYPLPLQLVQEWQTVLTADLAPDKVTDTLTLPHN